MEDYDPLITYNAVRPWRQ